MTKECKHCKNQFEPKTNRGHEQLYCTNSCAQQAARIRREERLKNQTYETKQTTETGGNTNSDLAQRAMGGISTDRRSDTDNAMAIIEKLYDAKIENNYLKLKCETLEEKIRQLQIEVNNLNSEIEAMEIDEEIDEQQGILGSVMQQFKTDPINTIAMVKMMFENLMVNKNETNGKKEKAA